MIIYDYDFKEIVDHVEADAGRKFLKENFKLKTRYMTLSNEKGSKNVPFFYELVPKKLMWRLVYMLFKPLILLALKRILEKLDLKNINELFD